MSSPDLTLKSCQLFCCPETYLLTDWTELRSNVFTTKILTMIGIFLCTLFITVFVWEHNHNKTEKAKEKRFVTFKKYILSEHLVCQWLFKIISVLILDRKVCCNNNKMSSCKMLTFIQVTNWKRKQIAPISY